YKFDFTHLDLPPALKSQFSQLKRLDGPEYLEQNRTGNSTKRRLNQRRLQPAKQTRLSPWFLWIRCSCSARSTVGWPEYPSCPLSRHESPHPAPCPVRAAFWDRKPAGQSRK